MFTVQPTIRQGVFITPGSSWTCNDQTHLYFFKNSPGTFITEMSSTWGQLHEHCHYLEGACLCSILSLLIPEGLLPQPALPGPTPSPKQGKGTLQWIWDPGSPAGKWEACVWAHVALHLRSPSYWLLGVCLFVFHCAVVTPGRSCLWLWYINVQFKMATHKEGRRTASSYLPVKNCTDWSGDRIHELCVLRYVLLYTLKHAI